MGVIYCYLSTQSKRSLVNDVWGGEGGSKDGMDP